jgi:DNA-binding IclR family transcriptional regulator
LLADHIESVVQVEMLLLLHADPSRARSAQEIAQELRIDPAYAQTELANLTVRGMLRPADQAAGAYQYGPGTAAMAAAVEGLAKAYLDRRVTVIGLVYSKPADQIRSFADAFRLRKEKGDG